MMSFCRNSMSPFLDPPKRKEDLFSQAFHQTSCGHPPLPFLPKGSPAHPAGNLAGGSNLGLMSCTESLGFESSDEISNFDDMGVSKNRDCCNKTSINNEDSSSSSCSSASSFSCGLRREKWTWRRSEEKKFPPPLSSLSENGRRNFTLKSTRKDGRLEIVGVMIERPEFLCASRQNGRLRLNLVRTIFDDDEDDDDDDDDDNDDDDDEEEEEEDEEEEEAEEEREWKIQPPAATAAGVRRCNHQGVWGQQQQQRCVTTM